MQRHDVVWFERPVTNALAASFEDFVEFIRLFSHQAFLLMVNNARVPHFAPEPPIFTDPADATLPETMFEKYVYLRSFHHDDIGLDMFLEFFKNYTELTPAFDGMARNMIWPIDNQIGFFSSNDQSYM